MTDLPVALGRLEAENRPWIDFVLARLAEDEAAAKAAPGSIWRTDESGCCVVEDEHGVLLENCVGSHADPCALTGHVIRNDPAAALRTVNGVRCILARYEDCLIRTEDPEYSTAAAADQAREYEDFVFPNLMLRWSDHPDYAAALADLEAV